MILAAMNAIYAIAYTVFEPLTSQYRCDALTNWAMKLSVDLNEPVRNEYEVTLQISTSVDRWNMIRMASGLSHFSHFFWGWEWANRFGTIHTF